jgi:flavorubredoxin
MKLVPIITPMLHWPDSMMTYLDVDGVLFSQDGFGMHLASTERFADELPADGVWYETAKYFANILTPFGLQIKKTLQKIQGLDIDIKIIANDHGPLWRGPLIDRVIGKYIEWCDQAPVKKAVITYASMWHSTEKMARAVASGVWSKGVSVKLEPLGATHRSDIMTELLEAGAFVLGTPTLNNQMFPTVADFLCYMNGLRPKNLVAATFGSYGWSGQAPKIAADILESMKLDMLEAPLKHIYVPDQEALDNCYALGERVGQAVLDKCEKG